MRIFLTLVGTLALTTAAHAADFTIKPGNYEVVSTISMPMMPNGMTNTTTQCVTEEDARQTPEDIANAMAQDGDCSVSNLATGSNAMSYDVACTGSDMGNMTGRFDITYTDTTWDMKAKMSGDMEGMRMDMDMVAKAKRIGACS